MPVGTVIKEETNGDVYQSDTGLEHNSCKKL